MLSPAQPISTDVMTRRGRFAVVIHVATEIEGTFRVNGSNKRMRDLQAAFETPPRVSIFLPCCIISFVFRRDTYTDSFFCLSSTGKTSIGRSNTIRRMMLPVYSGGS